MMSSHVAGQDFGPPGRVPGPRLEERHLRLTHGELVVERGQVGDLERDDEQADTGGDDLTARGPGMARRDDAQSEDRRARDAERREEVHPGGLPFDERDAQDEQAEPDDEEGHHGGGAHEGQNAVARPGSSGARGDRRAEPPRARASMRMAGEDVTRGTTSAVKTLHAVETTRRMPASSATRRTTDSTATSCQMPGREHPDDGQCVASLAVAGPLATSAAGTSPARERNSPPSPFACVSNRRFDATPQPRMPWTTKFTARRFGNGYRLTGQGRTSGRSAVKTSMVRSCCSQAAPSSSSAQTPTLASPPLSPERAPDEHPQRDPTMSEPPDTPTTRGLGRRGAPDVPPMLAGGLTATGLTVTLNVRCDTRPRGPSSANSGPCPDPPTAPR